MVRKEREERRKAINTIIAPSVPGWHGTNGSETTKQKQNKIGEKGALLAGPAGEMSRNGS